MGLQIRSLFNRFNRFNHVTYLTRLFGDHKGVVRPVPMPNTAVKRPIADGSGCIASARVGRRQIKKAERNPFGFFVYLGLGSAVASPVVFGVRPPTPERHTGPGGASAADKRKSRSYPRCKPCNLQTVRSFSARKHLSDPFCGPCTSLPARAPPLHSAQARMQSQGRPPLTFPTQVRAFRCKPRPPAEPLRTPATEAVQFPSHPWPRHDAHRAHRERQSADRNQRSFSKRAFIAARTAALELPLE